MFSYNQVIVFKTDFLIRILEIGKICQAVKSLYFGITQTDFIFYSCFCTFKFAFQHRIVVEIIKQCILEYSNLRRFQGLNLNKNVIFHNQIHRILKRMAIIKIYHIGRIVIQVVDYIVTFEFYNILCHTVGYSKHRSKVHGAECS